MGSGCVEAAALCADAEAVSPHSRHARAIPKRTFRCSASKVMKPTRMASLIDARLELSAFHAAVAWM